MVQGLCDTANKVRTKVKGAYYKLDDTQARYMTDTCGLTDLADLGEMETETFDCMMKMFSKPTPVEETTGTGAAAVTRMVTPKVRLTPIQQQKIRLLWRMCRHYNRVNQPITKDSTNDARLKMYDQHKDSLPEPNSVPPDSLRPLNARASEVDLLEDVDRVETYLENMGVKGQSSSHPASIAMYLRSEQIPARPAQAPGCPWAEDCTSLLQDQKKYMPHGNASASASMAALSLILEKHVSQHKDRREVMKKYLKDKNPGKAWEEAKKSSHSQRGPGPERSPAGRHSGKSTFFTYLR